MAKAAMDKKISGRNEKRIKLMLTKKWGGQNIVVSGMIVVL